MAQISAKRNGDLSLAGWLLVAELAFAVILGLLLSRFGRSTDFVLPCIWVLNLWPALHLSKAAKALGKSAALNGALAALLPAMAILVWARLYSEQLLGTMGKTSGDEA